MIVRSFGVQHTKQYLFGRVEHRFLPISTIHDFHIIDHVDPVKVICFLAFETKLNGHPPINDDDMKKELYPIFTAQWCLPKFYLVHIYATVHSILWSNR